MAVCGSAGAERAGWECDAYERCTWQNSDDIGRQKMDDKSCAFCGGDKCMRMKGNNGRWLCRAALTLQPLGDQHQSPADKEFGVK